MSSLKVVKNCEICSEKNGIYSCPRCNRRYCSSNCYKRPEHEKCSESFYREWVETSLQNDTFDRSEKDKMLQILKRCSDTDEASLPEKSSIEERFANLDINKTDENVIWEQLSEEERENFKAFIGDEKNIEEILPLKQPWWAVAMLNLVTELDIEKPDANDDIAPRPLYPLNVKSLKELTSKKASECIQYNLVNVLYAYSFLYRFYNCDFRDFMDEVVDEIFTLCPALQDQNYFSLVEAVQDSIRLISKSHNDVPVDFVKSIVNDVCTIIKGPDNAKLSTFVLCALHDIKLLFLELKFSLQKSENIDKKLKKCLNHATKKVEFLMSWCLDYENNLPDVASDLTLLMLPDMVESESNESSVNLDCEIAKFKPVIEEID